MYIGWGLEWAKFYSELHLCLFSQQSTAMAYSCWETWAWSYVLTLLEWNGRWQLNNVTSWDGHVLFIYYSQLDPYSIGVWFGEHEKHHEDIYFTNYSTQLRGPMYFQQPKLQHGRTKLQSKFCWCFVVDSLRQPKFCCVDLSGRSCNERGNSCIQAYLSSIQHKTLFAPISFLLIHLKWPREQQSRLSKTYYISKST